MRCIVTFLALALCLIGAPTVQGGFEFRISPDSDPYLSDGINPVSGFFNVVLRLTGPDLAAPPNVQGYSTAYDVATAGVTFGSPAYVPPGSGGINMPPAFFTGGLNGTATRFTASNDVIPGSTLSADNVILARVQFFAPSGFAGPIQLNFRPATTDLTDPAGNTYAGLEAFNGTLNVSAVPEPATLGLIGLGLVGVAGARRRFARRSTAA